MPRATDPNAPPSRELLFLELRAIWELSAFFASYPLLRMAPRGDGHAVLVLPGLAANDTSTRPLRRVPQRPGLGRERLGARPQPRPASRRRGEDAEPRSRPCSGTRAARSVSSAGAWAASSRARWRAAQPDHVRCVITLGSPFAGAPRASNAWQLYERASYRKVEDWPGREQMKTPPPVPTTAIFSRTDGIVAWQGCLEREGPRAENIEVEGSHCGLGHNPTVLYAIADRLAQPEGHWKPFDRSGLQEPDLPRSAPRRGHPGTGRLGNGG